MQQIVYNCVISAYPSHSSSPVQKPSSQLLFLFQSPKKMTMGVCDAELIS